MHWGNFLQHILVGLVLILATPAYGQSNSITEKTATSTSLLDYIAIGVSCLTAFILFLALRTTQRTFEANSRPWVTVEARIADNFFWNENNIATIPIMFCYKNIGHSPALNVYIRPEVFVCKTLEKNLLTNRQHKISKEVRKNPTPVLVRHIFPGETENLKLDLHTSREEIDEILSDFTQKRVAQKNQTFGIFIVGCAQYWSYYDKRPKQTGFIYELSTKNIAEQFATFTFRVGQNVAMPDLMLRRHFLGSGVID